MQATKKTLSREEYLDERKLLHGFHQAAFDSYERAVLALASALFAFSVAYLRLLPEGETIQAKFALVSSWCFFAVAILSILSCFAMNIKAYNVEIAKVDAATEDASALEPANPWIKPSYFIYWISGLTLAAGIAALIAFSIVNIGQL